MRINLVPDFGTDAEDLDFEAEITWADKWMSLNDWPYRMTPDGFGQENHTYDRNIVTTPYFAGSFTVNARPNTLDMIRSCDVFGRTHYDLEENLSRVIGWFTQTTYVYRERHNDVRKIYQAELADWSVIQTREYLHNQMTKVQFTFRANPYVGMEEVL